MAVACDGASSNRSFYKMHRPISGIVAPDVVYRTINLFDESRYIWFFSDTPHLMKTSRNCFYHSGSGPSKTRLMWNDGKEIIWDHILYAYHLQENKGLKLITKLKEEHVYLTPYSKMNVRLATQVLSETVYHGTAEFCSMMDKFFDIFNVKNNIEYISSSKPFLRPFSCFVLMTVVYHGLVMCFCDILKIGVIALKREKGILAYLISVKCLFHIRPI